MPFIIAQHQQNTRHQPLRTATPLIVSLLLVILAALAFGIWVEMDGCSVCGGWVIPNTLSTDAISASSSPFSIDTSNASSLPVSLSANFSWWQAPPHARPHLPLLSPVLAMITLLLIWASFTIFAVCWGASKRRTAVNVLHVARDLAITAGLLIPCAFVLHLFAGKIDLHILAKAYTGGWGLVVVSMGGVACALARTPNIDTAPPDTMTAYMLSWSRFRARRYPRFTFAVFLGVLLVIAGGVFALPCLHPLPIASFQSDPFLSGLGLVCLGIGGWLIGSLAIGRYRDQILGDPSGIHAPLASLGLSLAVVIGLLILVGASRAIFHPAPSVISAVTLVLCFGVCLDAVLNGISLLILPALAEGDDQQSILEHPDDTAVSSYLSTTCFRRLLHALSASPISPRRLERELIDMQAIPQTDIDLSELDQRLLHRVLVGCEVVLLFAALLLSQCYAVLRLDRIAFVHFLRFGSSWMTLGVDLLALIVLIGADILVYTLVARWITGSASGLHICHKFGRAFLPLVVVTILHMQWPDNLWFGEEWLLQSIGLLWGLYVLVCPWIPRNPVHLSRKIAFMFGLSVLLLCHWGMCAGMQYAHLTLIRAMAIPVVQVRASLPTEAATLDSQAVEAAVSTAPVIDLADVTAYDLLDQVARLRRVENRFYPSGQYPDGLSPVRIRREITAGVHWMQVLTPQVTRLIRGVRTPGEAVSRITPWVEHAVPDVQHLIYPPGSKFDQDPITTLHCRQGTQLDVAILLVAALRSVGIAARTVAVWPDQYVNNTYTLAEYYDGIQWLPCYPSTTPPVRPKVIPEDLRQFQAWAEKIPDGFPQALSVLVDGRWMPYCADGGRFTNGEFSTDVEPGSYLVTYIDHEQFHLRIFTLRPLPLNKR